MTSLYWELINGWLAGVCVSVCVHIENVCCVPHFKVSAPVRYHGHHSLALLAGNQPEELIQIVAELRGSFDDLMPPSSCVHSQTCAIHYPVFMSQQPQYGIV